MEKEIAAYLAGIVDGEGNIALMRRAAKPQCGEINPTFLDYVKIANTDYRLLSWVRDKVGAGTIYAERRKKENSRKVYTWHLSGMKCVAFLENIYPYLVIKKEQADLIFKHRQTFSKGLFCRSGVPADVIALREMYCREMAQLHNEVVHGDPVKAGIQTTEIRRKSQLDRMDYLRC